MIPVHPLADWWKRTDGFDGARTWSSVPIIMHTIGKRFAHEDKEREIFARHEMALQIAQAIFGWLR